MTEKNDQRRLAAILVADVVGSRLMEFLMRLPTLSALRGSGERFFEPSSEPHGGRVVKVMGDGVLVDSRAR